jgi:acyl carrier protein
VRPPCPWRSLACARRNETFILANEHLAFAGVRDVIADPRRRPVMSAPAREQVFALIQAHLADELDVDAGVIAEGTRFREDLEADSLDLYTLVQELEDTYGISMSDEQAAQILTVGQAVDFVLAHDDAR